MKPLLVFFVNLPSICVAMGALILALNNIKAWGWFLFAAAVMCKGFEFKSKNNE